MANHIRGIFGSIKMIKDRVPSVIHSLVFIFNIV